MEERLQKLLSAAGLCSRRRAEAYILEGRVLVNGHPAALGDRADLARDLVTLDGQPVQPSGGNTLLMLYKPRGVVTTLSDEKGRKTVAELVADCPARVWPVGRLDMDSEGLLIMTNDGNLANAVSHPKTHVAKTYRVTLRPGITEEQLIKLSTGIMLDGRMTAPAKARVLEQQPGRAVVEIVLFEVRNRQIRRMCESMGLEVARLKRTAIGPVRLSMLPQGRHRELSREEIAGLLAESGKGRSR